MGLGALGVQIEISLATRPKLDFDLRVVGNDITLVPGVAAPLRSLIKVPFPRPFAARPLLI